MLLRFTTVFAAQLRNFDASSGPNLRAQFAGHRTPAAGLAGPERRRQMDYAELGATRHVVIGVGSPEDLGRLTTGYTKVFDTDPGFPLLRKP